MRRFASSVVYTCRADIKHPSAAASILEEMKATFLSPNSEIEGVPGGEQGRRSTQSGVEVENWHRGSKARYSAIENIKQKRDGALLLVCCWYGSLLLSLLSLLLLLPLPLPLLLLLRFLMLLLFLLLSLSCPGTRSSLSEVPRSVPGTAARALTRNVQ